MMADCKITRVYTGITGSHIRGQNSTGMVIVRDKEVTPVDVARVVETAKAINIPNDQRLLLVEPQEFVIDGHEVKEPIGMSGGRLEVKVHIVTGAQSAAENILKCVRRCGLEVEQLVLNPSASSAAVLTEDEKDLGVALVDIGAGTTDVAIFTDGAIRHTAVILIAGDLITSDIAMALRTPTKDAEEIKVEYGVAKQLLADPNEQLEVPEAQMADKLKWTKPNDEVDLLFIDDAPSDIQLPSSVELEVTETEPGVRGDTASGGGNKPATLETGAQVNVPLFVNIGDRIKVDTRSGSYMSRA